jgi:hypothetical protein
MKKIPLGSISLAEVVYLLGFIIIVTVAVCLLIVMCMLMLMGAKLIAKTFFGGKGVSIIAYLLILVVGFLFHCRKKHSNKI